MSEEKKVEKFLDVVNVNGDVVKTPVSVDMVLDSIMKEMIIDGNSDDEHRTKAFEAVAKANDQIRASELAEKKQADDKELELLKIDIRNRELDIEERKAQLEFDKAVLESATSKEVNWLTNGTKILSTVASGTFMLAGTKAAFGMDQENVVSNTAMSVVRFFTGKIFDK